MPMPKKCYICGKDAAWRIAMGAPEGKEWSVNAPVAEDEASFFVCDKHEKIYEKLRRSISIKTYFDETLDLNT